MQKLKLNQLNKQQVADREMNAIKGGSQDLARLCDSLTVHPNAAYSHFDDVSECASWCDSSSDSSKNFNHQFSGMFY